MIYEIVDRVETGYSNGSCVGGTIRVKLTFDSYRPDTSEYSKLIDMLDHCFVTANEEAKKYSTRIFVLDRVTNFYEDVLSIVTQLINEKGLEQPKTIAVLYADNTLTSEPTTPTSAMGIGPMLE
jgi:hypothetical protein